MNIAASLIRDHRIGEHKLPRSWMIVCAGNHQHNRAGTTTMPKPCAQPARAFDDRR
jgi:hypothetical protein